MYLEKCNEDQLKLIYEELKTNEDTIIKNTKEIIKWLEEQPHLPNVKDEQWMANVVIILQNDVEKIKKRLDFYFTARSLLPEITLYREPHDEAFKKFFKAFFAMPLPKLTAEGDRIFVQTILNVEKACELTADQILRASSIILDICLKTDRYRKLILICDCKNVNTNLINTFLKVAKIMMTTGRKKPIIATHVTKIIMMNMNPVANSVFSVVKKFMKKKILERCEIWDKKETDLPEIFPENVLPVNYGGKEKSLEELSDRFYEYTTGFRDWLKSEEEVKADISKRVVGCLSEDTSFGVEGIFRQLSFD